MPFHFLLNSVCFCLKSLCQPPEAGGSRHRSCSHGRHRHLPPSFWGGSLLRFGAVSHTDAWTGPANALTIPL